MKVFNYKCPKDGFEYISKSDSVLCEECSSTCNIISEGDIEKLPEDVSTLINEEGTVRVVYHDGKKKVIKVRKKVKTPATSAQKAALAIARRLAHTPEADKKRRKSVAARKEAGLIGEGYNMSNITETFKKVVRNGEVVKKKIRLKKVILSPKQKAALRKAQAKAHTSSAEIARKISNKIRARKGLNEATDDTLYFIVLNDFTLEFEDGSIDLSANDLIVAYPIDEVDISIDIYDADGNVKDEDIEIATEDLYGFVDSGDIDPITDTADTGDMMDESAKNNLGGNVTMNGEEIKAIAEEIVNIISKELSGEVDEAYRKAIRNGKVVKIKKRIGPKKRLTPAQKAALRKARMKAHTGAANRNRKKSMKIHMRKLGEAALVNVGVSCLVSEAFEIVLAEDNIISVDAGSMFDIYDVDENMIAMDIYNAEGEILKEAVEVDAEFVANIYEENLVESLADYGITLNDEFIDEAETEKPAEDTASIEEPAENKNDKPEGDDVAEGIKLSFTTADGYIAIKEGKEFKLGSRVRARAFLLNEGVDVDYKTLDDARDGKEVTL